MQSPNKRAWRLCWFLQAVCLLGITLTVSARHSVVIRTMLQAVLPGTVFTYTIDTTTPLGSSAPSTIDDRIREAKAGWQERLNVDHFMPLTGSQVSDTDAGYHRDIHFYSTTATDPVLDFVTVGGIDELRYTDSAGSAVQFTSAGAFNVALLTGKTITSPVINTGISGTAVLDEDNMVSNSATKVATQQSIKAYVDNDIQTVNFQTGLLASGTTVMPRDNTIPQITEGDLYMMLAIAPTSATNKLKIEVVWNGATSVGSVDITVALFKDAVADALACASDVSYGQNDSMQICFVHYMTAGTTDAITFRVRAGMKSAGTTTFNGEGAAQLYGGVFASSITITEIRL